MRTKKVISTRINPEHLAKAIDGLKAKGYKADQLATISNIVRLTFYYGLANLGTATSKPSTESMAWINRNMNQGSVRQNLSLKEILK